MTFLSDQNVLVFGDFSVGESLLTFTDFVSRWSYIQDAKIEEEEGECYGEKDPKKWKKKKEILIMEKNIVRRTIMLPFTLMLEKGGE